MAKKKRPIPLPVMPGPSMMLGAQEIAVLWGLQTDSVYQLRTRGQFVPADDVVGGDPLWHAWTIVRFSRQTGRKCAWAPGAEELAETHWQFTERVTGEVLGKLEELGRHIDPLGAQAA